MSEGAAKTADVLGVEVGGRRDDVDFEPPGVAPSGAHLQHAAAAETDPKRGEPSEVITEIAPEVGPSETEPSEVITEIAPEVITEIAPETAPGYEPSEVITEIAPDGPAETEPERGLPSEVITEVAPEVSPEEEA